MKYELAVLSRGRADVLMNRQLTLTWLQNSHYPVSFGRTRMKLKRTSL